MLLDVCLTVFISIGASGEKYTIGLFDPAGFDAGSRKNPFDQMIYNALNEQMAYHYCQSVFAMEEV